MNLQGNFICTIGGICRCLLALTNSSPPLIYLTIQVYVIHYSKATTRRQKMEETLRNAGVDPNSPAVTQTEINAPFNFYED